MAWAASSASATWAMISAARTGSSRPWLSISWRRSEPSTQRIVM